MHWSFLSSLICAARRTVQSDSVSGYAARPFFAIFILATTFVLMNVVVGFLLGPAAARLPFRAARALSPIDSRATYL